MFIVIKTYSTSGAPIKELHFFINVSYKAVVALTIMFFLLFTVYYVIICSLMQFSLVYYTYCR